MNPSSQPRRALIITIIAAGVILAGGWTALSVRHHQVYSAQLKLTIVPSSSQVTINGQTTQAETIRIKPGFVTVTVSKTGFTTQKKMVEATKNQTTSVSVALLSNSPSTQNWYTTHPSDQQILEQISGDQFNQQSTQAVQQIPLIKQLPFIGAGFEYRIDYGAPLPGTTVPGIYITAVSQQGEQDALSWIQGQGYNPATLHIQSTIGTVN